VLERAPSADVLITRAEGGIDTLPQGARVGTSSVRRARQLAWLRPDIVIEEWRGNVPTRLRKLNERADVAGIVLAEAGLRRLGYGLNLGIGRLTWEGGEFHAASLEDRLLPAIGQGAVALQARADRPEVAELLSRINHEPTMLAVRAEREVQRLLAGDCSVPVGVRAELRGARIVMRGILFGKEGQTPIEGAAEGDAGTPESVARDLFRQLSGGA
jgi:hydroxymethylbilane synthase